MDFDHWAEGIRPKLVKLATAQSGDEHEAEDVVQETLTALWRRGPEGIENLDAYAARAVWQNAAQRRSRRKNFLPLDSELLRDAGFDEPTAKETIEDQLRQNDIANALAQLPEAQRTVVQMHYYGDLSFKEIGSALSISMNTAASRCRYALNQLRHALSAYSKE